MDPSELVRQLESSRGPLPASVHTGEKGIYAVWLDNTAWKHLKLNPGPRGIAYVGVAGGNGGLEKRFREEWRPKHSGRSSPRRTLGALLRRRLRLKPRPRPGKAGKNFKYFTFGDEGEQVLTDWIEAHSEFSYVEIDLDDWPGVHRTEDVETIMIRVLQPPLNIRKWRNPEKRRLAGARKRAADAALKRSIQERRSARS